jgi:HD-GYP domain-containing protein (c-di-GMP phosphodiesterase class II)
VLASPAPPRIRLAELIALLSLGTDLGLGQPMEHVIRQCLIALRLADRLGLDEPARAVIYYSGLLAWVGCHTDAYEQAKWFGDDIGLKAAAIESGVGEGPVWFLTHFGAGRPLLARAGLAVEFLGQGRRDMMTMLRNHYLATDELATRLGLGEAVRASLKQTFERWDGKGPLGTKGAEILLSSRLVNLADAVEVFHRQDGVDAAIAVARKRRGKQFDPTLVKLFCDNASELLDGLDSAGNWDSVLAAEPALAETISDEKFEAALEAVGDFADLKSPWRIGHARAVSALVAEAAGHYGLPDGEIVTLRRAALLADLGHLGVSNGVWDKRAPLTHAELERVRLHPYLTERMLASSPVLAPFGAIAVQHHERLDGSGYPRGLSGDAITPSGRLLGAADCYQAMTEPRPQRPALSPGEAEAALRSMVATGRLDGRAADAVLRAAGHRVRRRREWPAGMTAREVEVLRLVARGLSNKEIAGQLLITPKTAGSHIEHIYNKIEASNRAQAGLFAMKHGLMVTE